MSDVYERLAEKLDAMPNGYPRTESGVELKILEKIFSPVDAEIALKLRPMPETAEEIAERLGNGVPEMETILNNMVKKGQIGSVKLGGEQRFVLPPFVIGIYELQLNLLDEKMVRLFEEYLPELARTLGGFEPPLARVVPVSTEIKQDLHVHRYEDVRRMIEEAKSFQVTDCICRKEQAIEGNPCDHTLEICLFISGEEDAYEKYRRGRVISKEEALKVMADAEEEGLVHSTYNVEDGQTFVCNCCPCCCGILRGVKNFNAPHLLAKSHFVAAIEQESCTACGVCADERCPMDAIVAEKGDYSVLPERCIGCGVCVSTCPAESIRLERKPEAEHDRPPANLIDWNIRRAAERGIEMRLD